MDTLNASSKAEAESTDIETINEISEQAIRGEYLNASLHGPKWVLGLIGEAV